MKTEAGLACDDGLPTVMRMQGFRFVIWPDDHVPPHVLVRKGGEEVVINLIDGRIRDRRGSVERHDLHLSRPVGQGLADASDDELAEVEVWPTGTGLHWERLDADLGIRSLLNGMFGSKAWMSQLQAERGRKGGKVRSPSKAAAARENGKKGGRPHKRTSG